MSRGIFFAEGPGGWPPTGSNPPLTTPFSGPGGGLQDSLVEIPQRLYNQRVNSEITGRPPMSKITRPLLGRFFLCALSLFPLTGCAGEALRTEEPPPAAPLLHLQDHLLPDCSGARTPGPRALPPAPGAARSSGTMLGIRTWTFPAPSAAPASGIFASSSMRSGRTSCRRNRTVFHTGTATSPTRRGA